MRGQTSDDKHRRHDGAGPGLHDHAHHGDDAPPAGTRLSPAHLRRTRPDTLGRVIQALKSITAHGYVFGMRARGWPAFSGRLWQPGYYDHIIRGEEEPQRVAEYILANPARRDEDEKKPSM